MLLTIINAINAREMLSFTYSGIPRIVQPVAVGISRAGNEVLRCYQPQGGHVTAGHEWDLCKLSKILNLNATGQKFVHNPPGYKRGDSHMISISAEL